MQVSQSQHKAAGEYVELVAARLGSNRAVQSETAIATAARFAGSLLFRSFEFQLQGKQPGSIILSNEANEEGPQLINLMAAILQRYEITLDKAKLGGDGAKKGAEPSLSVLESLQLLQEDGLKIAKVNGLDLKQAAQSAALATGFIVKECARTIGGEVGFNIACYGFIEGTKTVPPYLGDQKNSEIKP